LQSVTKLLVTELLYLISPFTVFGIMQGRVWHSSGFQLQREAVVYNINLISFKNIFNLNKKQNDLSKCLLKVCNLSFMIV
jgi:hypothetical protein